MKTTRELAEAAGVSPERLKAQLKAVNEWRIQMRVYGDGGWTTNQRVGDVRISKKREQLATGRIPKWLWLHPELKDTYFANEQDQETRTKNMELFLKRYPEWRHK